MLLHKCYNCRKAPRIMARVSAVGDAEPSSVYIECKSCGAHTSKYPAELLAVTEWNQTHSGRKIPGPLPKLAPPVPTNLARHADQARLVKRFESLLDRYGDAVAKEAKDPTDANATCAVIMQRSLLTDLFWQALTAFSASDRAQSSVGLEVK